VGEAVGEWAFIGSILVLTGSIGRSYINNRRPRAPIHQ